jgi:hypothetical protein
MRFYKIFQINLNISIMSMRIITIDNIQNTYNFYVPTNNVKVGFNDKLLYTYEKTIRSLWPVCHIDQIHNNHRGNY